MEKVKQLYLGWERVFPICGFARLVGAACESLDPNPLVLCCIAENH